MSRRKKPLTNEQCISNLLHDLNPYEYGIIRERILFIMQQSKNDAMNPEIDWMTSNRTAIIQLADKVEKHLQFVTEPEKRKRRSKKEIANLLLEKSNIQFTAKSEHDGTVQN